jgi:1,4-dihydroxy-6-naphthoate synthase
MTVSLGFSPCPNDTFIFDALVNGKIDTQGLHVDVVLEDVQTLNQWALEGKLDFSKISYGVLPLILSNYTVLNSGGALGKGVGPLLITKDPSIGIEQVNELTIAVPGENTTAHLLLQQAFPHASRKRFHVFHEIEDLVLSGAVDAGVIIHENRFTYASKGLFKLLDLGSYWEKSTGFPIPLGGIVVHKRIPRDIALLTDSLIRKSLSYAFDHQPVIAPFVREHAQEMSEEVMQQHIDLYVNDFSLDLGTDGKKAVGRLLETSNIALHDHIFIH